jgi:hypothetical protein
VDGASEWVVRSPDRISPMLSALEEIWRTHPDLRLTQLILNACPSDFSRAYNVEDGDLLMRLDDAYPIP